jgi:hypothetical protein
VNIDLYKSENLVVKNVFDIHDKINEVPVVFRKVNTVDLHNLGL